MNSKRRLGFSLTEVTMVLGLIGILAVTMLSLNNFNANDEKMAMTKLAQADSAIMSWSKAQVGANETGLGLAQTITDQNSLDAAIQKYFNNSGSETGQDVNIVSMGETLNNATLYTLSNGVNLYAQYTLDSNFANLFGNQITTSTPVAIFIASVGDNNVEEFSLDQQGQLVNIADKYADRTPKVQGDDGDKYVVCVKTPCGDYKTNPENFVEIPDEQCQDGSCEGRKIYIGGSTTGSCGDGYTGETTTQTVGSILGDIEVTLSSCCPTPTFDKHNGATSSPICECNKAKMVAANLFSVGEVFENGSTCKRDAAPGEYADVTTRDAKLCGTDKTDNKGYYCDASRLEASKLCHKGNYCPQLTKDVVLGTSANETETADLRVTLSNGG